MQFRLLGPIAAVEDGGPLALGAPKQRALLATLLLRAGEVVSRDRLIDAVWGEEPPASALQSLQVYVHGLRRSLGPERIETKGVGYRIAVEEGELDLHRFELLVARGRAALESGAPAGAARDLAEALDLWAGRPLADIAEEPIAQAEAPRLEDARLRALELLHEAQLELDEHERLLDSLPPLLAEHPYRERLQAQYVRALYRAGRQKDSLDALRLAQRTLLDDLGIDAGPELRALERRILGQDPSLAAPAAAEAPLASLPTPATPILGRHLEVAALTALLRRDDVRLVTLTGPGGAGKTRLALAVAHELEPGTRDGAAFVDLAAVDDPRLLAGAIAHELGVQEADRPLEDELAAELRGRSMLLVLDNLEQLLPDVTLVARLLRDAPRLRVLATSRAPLRLTGEHEYPVPPLEPGEAIRLFGARAAAVDPSFTLDDESTRDVGEICRRLDGLPLAIELAAARTKLLPVGTMASRLEQALDLLTGGARDLPERQRTLRATLDWSYQLAEPAERELLARLAVFAGGFTIEGAEALGGDVETVASLVDKSLVRRGANGRFSLLETIREYALDRLENPDDARRAHATYFLERARAGDYLSHDAENLRAALAWTIATGDVAFEVDLLVEARQFWMVRGEVAEGRRYFDAAIGRTAGGDPELRARALANGAVFPYRQGAFEVARASWEEALEIFRELGDEAEIGRCLAELGGVAVGLGDLDAAARQYEDSLEHFTRLGKSLRAAMALSNLGAIASMRGDHERAAQYLEQAIETQRDVDRDGLGISLHNLARALIKLGRVDEARAMLGESLDIARELGYRELLAYCLGGAAEIAAGARECEHAARLLGASQAMFESIGVRMQGDEAETHAALTAELRASLGDEELDALLHEGRAADADAVAAGALAERS